MTDQTGTSEKTTSKTPTTLSVISSAENTSHLFVAPTGVPRRSQQQQRLRTTSVGRYALLDHNTSDQVESDAYESFSEDEMAVDEHQNEPLNKKKRN